MILIAILGILAIGSLIFTAAFCKDLWLLVKTHTPWWVWLLVIVLGVAVVVEAVPEKDEKSFGWEHRLKISDRRLPRDAYRTFYQDESEHRVVTSQELTTAELKEMDQKIRNGAYNYGLIYFHTPGNGDRGEEYAWIASLGSRTVLFIEHPFRSHVIDPGI